MPKIRCERIYVFAGTYREAENFVNRRNDILPELVYVNCLEKLIGLRRLTLHVVGTSYGNLEYSKILEQARIQDFKVVLEDF